MDIAYQLASYHGDKDPEINYKEERSIWTHGLVALSPLLVVQLMWKAAQEDVTQQNEYRKD